jgi:hypothetical protein
MQIGVEHIENFLMIMMLTKKLKKGINFNKHLPFFLQVGNQLKNSSLELSFGRTTYRT